MEFVSGTAISCNLSFECFLISFSSSGSIRHSLPFLFFQLFHLSCFQVQNFGCMSRLFVPLQSVLLLQDQRTVPFHLDLFHPRRFFHWKSGIQSRRQKTETVVGELECGGESAGAGLFQVRLLRHGLSEFISWSGTTARQSLCSLGQSGNGNGFRF